MQLYGQSAQVQHDEYHVERQYYRVKDIVKMTGISKGKVYQSLQAGSLRALKLDGLLSIPVKSYHAWIAGAVAFAPANRRRQ